MKKLLAICLAAALAAGLCACLKIAPKPEPTSEPTGTQAEGQPTTQIKATAEEWVWDGREIPVDKAKIVTKDVADCPDFLEVMTAPWIAAESRPLANSYIIQKQESYLDAFYRAEYTAYPDFRDEILEPGMDAVKAFYEQQYRAALTKESEDSFFSYDTLTSVESEAFHYSVQVYSIEIAGNYLSVNIFTDWYGGGAHGSQGKFPDVFDLRTGRRLDFEDIAKASSFEAINTLVEEYLRANDIYTFEETFDIREITVPIFRMTKEGPVLIFNPYEIAPYAEGIIEIPIPFSALGG